MPANYRFDDKLVLVFSAFVLIISYVMVYLFDLHNLFGVRGFFISEFDSWPFFWYHWFKNGGPIEIIQYFLLGAGALVSIKNSSRGSTKFWSLMGIALILMLIEDAGDIRHTIRIYVQTIANESEQGFYGTLTELVYFSVLAFIPVYAFVRYGPKALQGHKKTATYFVVGFIFYAVATGASFIGSAFHSLLDKNFYMITGRYLLNLIVSISDQKTAELYSQNKDWISFYLMDSPVEESIELLGASMLLAACLSYARRHV